MTLRIMLAALAGLALAACNSQNDDCTGPRCEDDHSGQNDTLDPIDNDPFGGDDQFEVTFATDFGGVSEESDAQLTCTIGAITKTTSGSSSDTFSVDRNAECTYSLGARGICENTDLCHQSADGRLWTKSGDLGAITENQEVTAVANWYFEAAELRCSFGDREVTSLDVFVDDQNTFQIDGIASDGSWFLVEKDEFGYAGRALERGWNVANLILDANSADFTVDMVTSTVPVACTW